MSARRVGLAYSPAALRHDPGAGHPERAQRISAITQTLQATGTWERLQVWEPAEIETQLLELVHTPAHVERIRQLTARGGGRIDPDTAASPGSWEAALRAAGGALEAVDRVSSQQLDAAFCLARPPGHHATPDRAMGFCLFNNVAVAAAWLLHSGRARKVAILDFDVHHGNGTQDAFAARTDVLYVSTHQWPLYPGTGDWRETGAGTIANIPLPPGAGDAVELAAFERLIAPLVRQYQPDFVLVSLGFDAFWRDPLANLMLSIGGGYAPLLRRTVELAEEVCGGRLVVALEGGYDLDALALGAESVCRLLLGQAPPDDPIGPAPDQLDVRQVAPLFAQIERLQLR